MSSGFSVSEMMCRKVRYILNVSFEATNNIPMQYGLGIVREPEIRVPASLPDTLENLARIGLFVDDYRECSSYILIDIRRIIVNLLPEDECAGSDGLLSQDTAHELPQVDIRISGVSNWVIVDGNR